MVSEKKVKLSKDEYYALFDAVSKKKYYVHKYFNPPRMVETDIFCPVCNEMLIYIQAGASYTIKCPTEDCVDVAVRGI